MFDSTKQMTVILAAAVMMLTGPAGATETCSPLPLSVTNGLPSCAAARVKTRTTYLFQGLWRAQCDVTYYNASNSGDPETHGWSEQGGYATPEAARPNDCECSKMAAYPPDCPSVAPFPGSTGGATNEPYDGPQQQSGTPVVLSLSGAVRCVAADVLFDIDADGEPDHLGGWVGSQDVLLALDRNDDGAIDSGAELFGERTVGSGGLNGYLALAYFDIDQDGQVNNDELPGLLLWQDDGDAVSSPGELTSAWNVIASVGTLYQDGRRRDPAGNLYRWAGRAVALDGHPLHTVDVIFPRLAEPRSNAEADRTPSDPVSNPCDSCKDACATAQTPCFNGCKRAPTQEAREFCTQQCANALQTCISNDCADECANEAPLTAATLESDNCSGCWEGCAEQRYFCASSCAVGATFCLANCGNRERYCFGQCNQEPCADAAQYFWEEDASESLIGRSRQR